MQVWTSQYLNNEYGVTELSISVCTIPSKQVFIPLAKNKNNVLISKKKEPE